MVSIQLIISDGEVCMNIESLYLVLEKITAFNPSFLFIMGILIISILALYLAILVVKGVNNGH